MASLGVRLSRANRSLLYASSRPSITVSTGTRCLASSACRRYHRSPATRQSAEVPADKYQRTTITEDVQRVAARQSWADPRANATRVNQDAANEESMVDPTIRHFTVNFVSPKLPPCGSF